MAYFLATYDAKETRPDGHMEILKAAPANGWNLWILGDLGLDRSWYRLPNTTLDGEFLNMNAAVAALDQTIKDASRAIGRALIAEKWIVVEYTAARFYSDKRSKT
jgi:hypothetical protein